MGLNSSKTIIIDCSNLTKDEINDKIETDTKDSTSLKIERYGYEDLAGLTLPQSLTKFYCFNNEIKSFAGLTLPDSLKEFSCSNNKITSFDRLILPSSLEYFDCFNNKITSFDELKLPESIREFNCYNNKITSFTGLTLPPLLTFFRCSENQITVVKDFEFPTNLISLIIDGNVKFINPKFNSVLRVKLRNKVEFDNKLRYDDLNYRRNLLFLYLNFSMTYNQYNHILDELAS